MTMQMFDMQLETKALGEAGEFEGFGAIFGNVDQGGDVIEKGAFSESLAEINKSGRLVPMLWQHQRDQPIGRWDVIEEQSKGLYVKGRLLIDDDPLAARAHAHLKAGTIGGMSIGYNFYEGGWAVDAKRPNVTIMKRINLREVSLVTMPMNDRAKVTGVKSAEVMTLKDRLAAGDRLTMREWEALLKAVCDLSNAEAERAARLHFKGQGEPDADALKKSFLHKLIAG